MVVGVNASRRQRLAVLRAVFDRAAPEYAHQVAPLLAPLYDDFLAYAAPQPDDRVLDLGTGPGDIARRLAHDVRLVIGLDLSSPALALARQADPAHIVPLVRGDLERLPFRAGNFSLITASFALHATSPQRSLPSLRRALIAGGRLIIQEWGPADRLHLALDDLLADYASVAPPPALAALRQALAELPPLWGDRLQDVEDYREWLTEYGFGVEHVCEGAPVTLRIPSAEAYLRFLLARPDRRAEVEAMSAGQRETFLDAARSLLAAAVNADGEIVWAPVLFRVRARRL